MRTALITVDAPAPFLALDDAKQHLRVDTSDEDELISAIVSAVCGLLDGPDGILKCAVAPQTLKLVLPGFMKPLPWGRSRQSANCGTRIELPLPPATDIGAITYYDSSGTQQTLDEATYTLIECGSSPSFLIPAPGANWPSTQSRPDAVSIIFDAGSSEDSAVPPTILAAAKLMVGDLYLNREATVYGPGAALENPAVKALLSPWRILKL